MIKYEPDAGAITKRQKLESIVYQAVGTASLCWSPKPIGVFDDATAKEVGDALIEAINKVYMLDVDHSQANNDIGV